ncbi:MAG: bifunctional enoyl-CoA hydratase/phosphate acetyltransferase [Thermotogaceae bacterium]|nr:bifunctional enoyl-CoA hydratase/phosphate acetyltransferase [Thermotogaceae bacterium]
MLRSFEELLEKIRKKGLKKIVLAGAEDFEALKAIARAYREGLCDAILVGKEDDVKINLKNLNMNFEIVGTRSENETAEVSVKLISSGEADLLMKGLIKTSTLLKAVLNKEWGLRTERLLSHVILMEIPGFDRLLFLTDGGMVIRPSLEEKVQIIMNAVDLAKRLGYEKPKVALITAVETVNEKMPETVEASIIAKMAERGQIKGCIIDGPLGFDNAVSTFAARVKGIKSDVAGVADILVVPDIHSGNFLGKSVVYFAKGRIAGVVVGARKPVVIVSRADTEESKFYSVVLGIAVS